MSARLMTRSAREWVRTNGMSLRVNGPPDGWVADQGGPVWWIGSDSLNGPVGPNGPAWPAYGYLPPNGGLVGPTYGGRPIDEAYLTGRGILPAITRATNLIVGPVIQTTWRYYSGVAMLPESDVRLGQEVLTRPLWTTDPQLIGSIPGGAANRPTLPIGRRLGPHDFWRTLLTHAVWWGIGGLMFVEDSFGSPLAGTMRVVNPAMWAWTSDGRLVLDPDGELPIESDFDGYFDVGPYRWRMVLLRNFAPCDGETAGGALTRSGTVILGTERANNYLSSVLNSGVPSGVLKVNVPNYGEVEATALKASWMESHGGSSRSIAVLNAGVDFTPLQLSPVDSDVVAVKSSLEVDIAHAFNMSSSWLDVSSGTGTNITYANLGERRRDLLDHTLAYHGRSVEDLITSLLPYGTAMRVDWSGYLATDPNQQLAFVTQGLAEQWLTIEEVRAIMGRRPMKDQLADETAAGISQHFTPAPTPAPQITTGGPADGNAPASGG